MQRGSDLGKVQKQESIANGVDSMEYQDLYARVRNGEGPRISALFLNKGTTRVALGVWYHSSDLIL